MRYVLSVLTIVASLAAVQSVHAAPKSPAPTPRVLTIILAS